MKTRFMEPKKAAFEKLHKGFLEEILPTLEEVEFEPSVFSSHHFGRDGRDYLYTFNSLQESKIIDLLLFEIRRDEACIKVFYNRVGTETEIKDLSELSGKSGLSLFIMPARSTQKEIHRWVPIPFLKIPSSYKVTDFKTVDRAEKSADEVLRNLEGDLSNFDIIRSEWGTDRTPIQLPLDNLS